MKNEMAKEKKYKQIELVQTCLACPEQYDAIYEGSIVGYLRLRHGHFYTEHDGKRVYESNPIGDGIFDSTEREKELKNAKKAIWKSIKKNK